MPLLAVDHEDMRQLRYENDVAVPTTSQPSIAPIEWKKDYSGIDWSWTIARNARLNNRNPAATMVAWDDIRAWNPGFWSGALITPRHVLVCHHYWSTVKSQMNSMRFISKEGEIRITKADKVYPSITSDITILRLSEALPESFTTMPYFADVTRMPKGTIIWIQSPQMRSYALEMDVVIGWKDNHTNDPIPYAYSYDLRSVPGDPYSQSLIPGWKVPPVFSGDSGSIMVCEVPGFGPAIFGMYWGSGIIRHVEGPGQPKSPFQAIKDTVNIDGYDVQAVIYPGREPIPPHRNPDITGDGKIDGADLNHILSNWGKNTWYADLNRDGIVDAADLAILLSNWGNPDEKQSNA